MKICFVTPTLNTSGGIRVVSVYAKLLAGRGHHVTIVSQGVMAVYPLLDQVKAVRRIGLQEHFKRLRSGFGPLNPFFATSPEVKHVVVPGYRKPRARDFPDSDVVIATWWETAEWIANLPAEKGRKFYFVQGHELFDYLPLERVKATYRLGLQKIVVAHWLKQVMSDSYEDPTARTVPNAVDRTQFFAPVRGKQDRPTIGFLYATAPLKALDVVFSALRLIRVSLPNARFVAFGVPEMPEQLVAEFNVLYCRHPAQESLRDIYAQCDVWLTASHSEGFNLPAMEAMACRTPVISTRTGWPAEAVIDGKNGYLVTDSDLSDIANRSLEVLSLGDTDWRLMSLNAFQTVEGSSWDHSTKMFEQALIDPSIV